MFASGCLVTVQIQMRKIKTGRPQHSLTTHPATSDNNQVDVTCVSPIILYSKVYHANIDIIQYGYLDAIVKQDWPLERCMSVCLSVCTYAVTFRGFN